MERIQHTMEESKDDPEDPPTGFFDLTQKPEAIPNTDLQEVKTIFNQKVLKQAELQLHQQ